MQTDRTTSVVDYTIDDDGIPNDPSVWNTGQARLFVAELGPAGPDADMSDRERRIREKANEPDSDDSDDEVLVPDSQPQLLSDDNGVQLFGASTPDRNNTSPVTRVPETETKIPAPAHAASTDALTVRSSEVGTGNGVFANRAIEPEPAAVLFANGSQTARPQVFLAEYTGTYYQHMDDFPPDASTVYTMAVRNGGLLDAADEEFRNSTARYIQHASHTDANAMFYESSDTTIHVIAIRPIAAHAEVTCDYGQHYAYDQQGFTRGGRPAEEEDASQLSATSTPRTDRSPSCISPSQTTCTLNSSDGTMPDEPPRGAAARLGAAIDRLQQRYAANTAVSDGEITSTDEEDSLETTQAATEPTQRPMNQLGLDAFLRDAAEDAAGNEAPGRRASSRARPRTRSRSRSRSRSPRASSPHVEERALSPQRAPEATAATGHDSSAPTASVGPVAASLTAPESRTRSRSRSRSRTPENEVPRPSTAMRGRSPLPANAATAQSNDDLNQPAAHRDAPARTRSHSRLKLRPKEAAPPTRADDKAAKPVVPARDGGAEARSTRTRPARRREPAKKADGTSKAIVTKSDTPDAKKAALRPTRQLTRETDEAQAPLPYRRNQREALRSAQAQSQPADSQEDSDFASSVRSRTAPNRWDISVAASQPQSQTAAPSEPSPMARGR